MTVTETARDSVVSAVEQERVASHLNPPASYDLADHPVPTGREEIWRFTPLKRLRGILEGEASDARLTWETELPAGVTLSEIGADARAVGTRRPSGRAAPNYGTSPVRRDVRHLRAVFGSDHGSRPDHPVIPIRLAALPP